MKWSNIFGIFCLFMYIFEEDKMELFNQTAVDINSLKEFLFYESHLFSLVCDLFVWNTLPILCILLFYFKSLV